MDALARMACSTANAEARRALGVEPFTPEQYELQRDDRGTWRWGQLDLAAHGGYSAAVVLAPDGTIEDVKVFWVGDLPEEDVE